MHKGYTIILVGLVLGAAWPVLAVAAESGGTPPAAANPSAAPGTPPKAAPAGAATAPLHWNPAVTQLDQELSLSEDQKSLAQAILEERDQQTRAVWADKTLANGDKESRARAIQKSADLKIGQLLTPEQRQKREENDIRRRASGEVEYTLRNLAKTITLSDDQKTKIQAAIESGERQSRPVREDSSLQPKDRDAKLHDIHVQVGVAIQQALTPEQRDAIEEAAMAPDVERQTEATIKDLSLAVTLSDDQKASIKALVHQAEKQSRAIRNDSTIPSQEKWPRAHQIEVARNAAVRQVLTPEQRQSLDNVEIAGVIRKDLAPTLERIARGVPLTDAQKARVRSILEQHQQQVINLRYEINLDQKAKDARRGEVEKATQQALDSILTPAQRGQVAQVRQRETAEREAGDWLQKLDTTLKLTDNQKAAVKPILLEGVIHSQWVREDPVIPWNAKDGEIKATRQRAEGRLKTLLTPEQKKKLQESQQAAH